MIGIAIPNACETSTTTEGYDICYQCDEGFEDVGGDQPCTICIEDGTWTGVTISCKLLNLY